MTLSQIRIKRHGALDYVFKGELIASANSQDGYKPRWQTMNLYRTESGKYVLEDLGETSVDGEVTMRDARVYENAHQVMKGLYRRRPDGTKYLTIVATELLDAAGEVDSAFAREAVEKI